MPLSCHSFPRVTTAKNHSGMIADSVVRCARALTASQTSRDITASTPTSGLTLAITSPARRPSFNEARSRSIVARTQVTSLTSALMWAVESASQTYGTLSQLLPNTDANTEDSHQVWHATAASIPTISPTSARTRTAGKRESMSSCIASFPV